MVATALLRVGWPDSSGRSGAAVGLVGGPERSGSVDERLEQEVNLLHASICQALADPKRILILYALSEGPRTVTELTECLDVPQPTVSRHLKVLRERRLVATERAGTSVILLAGRYASHRRAGHDARRAARRPDPAGKARTGPRLSTRGAGVGLGDGLCQGCVHDRDQFRR